jgi:hypothetical protein
MLNSTCFERRTNRSIKVKFSALWLLITFLYSGSAVSLLKELLRFILQSASVSSGNQKATVSIFGKNNAQVVVDNG